jgi:hypothetical protein
MAPAPAEDPMADFDQAFDDDALLDPEEKPFRFS